MLDGFLLQEHVGRLLLEEGVRLQLVHRRFHLVVQKEVLQAFVGKARHTDGADASLLVESFHRPPCGVVVSVGFVHQVKVEVIQSELLHRAIESPQRVVVLVVLHPQFGGDEKLLARDAALPDGIAQLLLVEIGSSRVEQSVTHLDGIGHHPFRFIFRNLKDAEPDGRHHHSVIQSYIFHILHSFNFRCKVTEYLLFDCCIIRGNIFTIRGF